MTTTLTDAPTDTLDLDLDVTIYAGTTDEHLPEMTSYGSIFCTRWVCSLACY